MTKIFLDSDVLIELLARRENYLEIAALMAILTENKVLGCTTPLVLANVDYIITKYSNKTKSKKALKSMRKSLSILPMDETSVDKALESEFSDFEDALQYFTVEKQGVEFIITRNKQDYKTGRLKVLTAKEFIDLYYLSDNLVDG